jgi:succinate dehydrogenase flavin-adding protein (antitoxin of CptAB toxin-antitoxin module)
MKVLVLGSIDGYKEYKKAYNRIKQIIDELDGVTRIELETNGTQKKVHYHSVKRKIFEADAVIIDTSHSSFRLGHEATISVQKGKPTLVLSQNKDYSDFIDAPNLFAKQYAYLELDEIITSFVNQAKRRIYSKRFNLFISEEQEEFLEEYAKIKKISKSEALREALEKMKSKNPPSK